jgi:indolepyruvate ferredoxin oxidoreductase beta subunit
MDRNWDRPLSIAMLALGGQGGGVLTKWLVDIAEFEGYLAQSTFVAGVAQRTGATVYCVEMFPREQLPAAGRDPVFTPYPVPGDVDMVVAGEITEAGRAILKGFVTPNATTVIASTHRSYSIEEKAALGNGIVDQQPVINAVRAASKSAVLFDMEAAASASGAVISAVMLGAVAAGGALPFGREAFEAAIRRDGRAVEANLRGFAAGFDGASTPVSPAGDELPDPAAEGSTGKELLARVAAEMPAPVRHFASHGALRALDYQDATYAGEYVDKLGTIVELDSDAHGFALSAEVARLLALQMCYEDTIRVARLKTARSRFERVREHLNVGVTQPAYITEYFHPRIEEVCDTLPASIGRRIARSDSARRLFEPLFRKGRTISTNKLAGFLLLSLVSRLQRWRRGTYRFAEQTRMIDAWLDRVRSLAREDYDLALALASSIEIVRGYGDTWRRGFERYSTIMDVTGRAAPGRRVDTARELLAAALADEEGKAFGEALGRLEAA